MVHENLLQWSAAWWNWIAPLAVQGTVLILLVALVDRLLPRRTWPQLRAALWLMVLARLLLPPQITLPRKFVASFSSAASTAWWNGALFARITPGNWALAVVGIWATGVALLAAWGTLRSLRMHRALRRLPASEVVWLATAVRRAARCLGMKRLPRVHQTSAVASPFVAGLWRPCVYLPASLRQADAHHVLLHELAHIQRRDLWLAALASAVPLIYWFHPLVWWAKWNADALREQCCDRTVTRALGGDALAYRRTLARFATARLAGKTGRPLTSPVAGLGFMRPRNLLLARLEMLQYARGENALLRRVAVCATLAIGLAVAAPMAHPAARASQSVAEWIERPAGCLPLRFMVFERLAEQRNAEEGPPPKPSFQEEN